MAARPHAQDPMLARKARLAAGVMAGTAILWLGAQALGAAMGWPVRFVFLFDFAALAALFWALVVTFQIWRARQSAGHGGE
ncbi:DUF5337 domain-containing protein [Meridianimarinicoccus sp. RP-17]|uniref:DUF5337 domain-containing protein n=1 Tax=Meridianimarinicoccus zhengii TaxID=2056810 RepID=UPI000DAC5FAD|nr:DUF5337 domain-containing protein [Phycocomes zhengii]